MNVVGHKLDDYLPPPPPPPKIIEEKSALPPVPLDTTVLTSSSLTPNDPSTPVTPTSPGGSRSQTPSPLPEAKSKKSNPLTELVETEKLYVDHLAGIIRKVASAWSRSNLPPRELDQMFRAVEAVYKANRSLLSKLREIGTSPSSPKALGDLLMRWIDDLEPPYATYCNKYTTGFDTWEPVSGNAKLMTTLAAFSASNPPPLPPSSQAHPSEPPLWTLDSLFLLPHGRLKYYKKLYGRLLKSTAPGRSDHKLLIGAMEKLERLLETVEGRFNVRLQSYPPIETEDEVVVGMRDGPPQYSPLEPRIRDTLLSNETDSRHASTSSGGNQSQTTAATSVDRNSGPTPPVAIADIERRLSTAKTLDLFTMNPRETRLQIETPGLTHTREVRMSLDVVIDFTPKSTGQPMQYPRGHIFLLTDLFLICEWILPSERAEYGGASDISLIFPPLAGKHLKVSEVPDSDTALNILILRKETLIINTPSPQVKLKLLAEFRDCIDAATNLHQRAKNTQPPPPVPNLPRSISSPLPSSPPNGPPRPEFGGPGGPPIRGLPSSHSLAPDERRFSPPSQGISAYSEKRWSPSGPPKPLTQRALSQELQLQNGPHRVVQEQSPDPLGLQRTSSTAETVMDGPAQLGRHVSQNQGLGGPGPSFPPGQGMPPAGSFGPGQVMPSSFGPGQIMRQPSFSPGQVLPRSMSLQRGQGPPPRNMMSPPPGHGGPPPPRNMISPPPGQMGPFPPRNTMNPPAPRNMMSPPPDLGPPPLGGSGGPPPPGHTKPLPPGNMGPPLPGYPGPPPKGAGLPSHPVPSLPGPNGMGPPPPGTWPPGPPGPGQHPGGPPLPSQHPGGPPLPGQHPGGLPLPGQPPFQSGPPRSLPPMSGQPQMVPPRGPPGPNGPNPNIPPHQFRQPTMDMLQSQPIGGPGLNGLRKTQSSHSLNSQFDPNGMLPPVPRMPGAQIPRNHSADSLPLPELRPLLPSAQRSVSMAPSSQSFYEISPPNSPVREAAPYTGQVTSTISAQMKCKVFLKQQHAQWKSLGSAKLKLYRESPTNVKQLVVEADNKDKSILISTIVLTDGVERVGKTGVAIELSDKGVRAGVVYMLQLRNEKSAQGLFDSLLAGSDRS